MHIITSNPLSLLRLKTLVVEGSSIELSDELVQKIQNSRDYLDQKTSSFLLRSCRVLDLKFQK